jgi:membrane associated rhomboid family serine protease
MFPIRDHNPSGRKPFVTYALIAINMLVFLGYWGQFSAQGLDAFFYTWGLVPDQILSGRGGLTLITHMFLHGGWMHLLGNLLFLWIFGDNMEDAFGHLRYLGFYLLCGLAAAALQIAGDPSSNGPMVGASGAIAGVLGGYLLLFPRAKVDVLIIFIVFFRIFAIQAWIVLGIWFGLQLINGLGATQDGVAYLAHVGGFVAGAVLTFPALLRLGGVRFWRQTHGQPPHPEAKYRLVPSHIPRVPRK